MTIIDPFLTQAQQVPVALEGWTEIGYMIVLAHIHPVAMEPQWSMGWGQNRDQAYEIAIGRMREQLLLTPGIAVPML